MWTALRKLQNARENILAQYLQELTCEDLVDPMARKRWHHHAKHWVHQDDAYARLEQQAAEAEEKLDRAIVDLRPADSAEAGNARQVPEWCARPSTLGRFQISTPTAESCFNTLGRASMALISRYLELQRFALAMVQHCQVQVIEYLELPNPSRKKIYYSYVQYLSTQLYSPYQVTMTSLRRS